MEWLNGLKYSRILKLMEGFSKKTLLGYTVMILCDILWVASGTAVQLLERKVPDFQLGFLRYLGGMLLASFPMTFSKAKLILPVESYVPILKMGLCSFTYNVLYFFAASILPLSHLSFAIFFTMTTVAIASTVTVEKSFDGATCLSIVGCTFGLVLMIQPWLDFTSGFTPGFADTNFTSIPADNITMTNTLALVLDTKWLLLLGYLALVLAGIVEAYYLLLAAVHLKDINPSLLIFLTAALCAPMSLISSFYLEDQMWIFEPYTILLVSIHVVGTELGLLMQIIACQLIKPIQVAIISNIDTVLYLIPQYTILNQHLYGRKNTLEVVGCIMITVFITMSSLFNDEGKHEDL